MKGIKCATAFFITLADLITCTRNIFEIEHGMPKRKKAIADYNTCGRNIFPAPKRSPTMDMPLMRGPSITLRGLG